MKRLVSRFFGTQYKELVGRDKYGNLYYKVYNSGPNYKRVALNKSEAYQQPADVPPAWQAWMNGQRENVPTEQDCETTQHNRPPISMTESHPLPPHLDIGVSHASAPSSGAMFRDTSEPESHGSTFNPGSWSPK